MSRNARNVFNANLGAAKKIFNQNRPVEVNVEAPPINLSYRETLYKARRFPCFNDFDIRNAFGNMAQIMESENIIQSTVERRRFKRKGVLAREKVYRDRKVIFNRKARIMVEKIQKIDSLSLEDKDIEE